MEIDSIIKDIAPLGVSIKTTDNIYYIAKKGNRMVEIVRDGLESKDVLYAIEIVPHQGLYRSTRYLDEKKLKEYFKH